VELDSESLSSTGFVLGTAELLFVSVAGAELVWFGWGAADVSCADKSELKTLVSRARHNAEEQSKPNKLATTRCMENSLSIDERSLARHHRFARMRVVALSKVCPKYASRFPQGY
jgi:hypothetical protein